MKNRLELEEIYRNKTNIYYKKLKSNYTLNIIKGDLRRNKVCFKRKIKSIELINLLILELDKHKTQTKGL